MESDMDENYEVPRKEESRRIGRLIAAIRHSSSLLPGDRLALAGEDPALYLGAFEAGDIQTQYQQVHAFRLHDGLRVIVEAPALNRNLGRLLY